MLDVAAWSPGAVAGVVAAAVVAALVVRSIVVPFPAAAVTVRSTPEVRLFVLLLHAVFLLVFWPQLLLLLFVNIVVPACLVCMSTCLEVFAGCRRPAAAS